MIVARQFTCLDFAKAACRPAGYGMIRGTGFFRPHPIGTPGDRGSHRALRDGFFAYAFQGNKLPGYDHSFPSGHFDA